MNRGSPGRRRAARRAYRRFNEAPIHESGKSPSLMSILDSQGAASMRPRFMNRGSETYGECVPERGIGFNEAPIHESGK